MTQISYRQIHQTLKREVKRTLINHGVNPSSRQGNKELAFILKRLAQQQYDNLDAVVKAGQDFGGKIAAATQQRGKQHLDGGVIRQLGVDIIAPKPTKSAPPASPTAATSDPLPRPQDSAPEVVANAPPAPAAAPEAEEAETDMAAPHTPPTPDATAAENSPA